MKEFNITIMSIDRLEDPDDNHQKYCLTVQSTDYETAKRVAKHDFQLEHPDLPIFWIR